LISCFVGKGRDKDVEGYTLLDNKFEDGVSSSNHQAVVGDVVMKG